MKPTEPEPLPPGGYDPRGLPRQGDPDAPRCHVVNCNRPKRRHHGVYFCPVCDLMETPEPR